MNSKIIIIFNSIKFYSDLDKEFYFDAFKKIKSIIKIESIDDKLYLYIKSNVIPRNDLGELMALFSRYKIKNPSQLKVFANKRNNSWFNFRYYPKFFDDSKKKIKENE